MKLADAPAKDKAAADVLLDKINKAKIDRAGMYRSWESRKEKVRVKLYSVYMLSLAQRGMLHDLGFKQMSGRYGVTNSWVAYIDHKDLPTINAVSVPTRRTEVKAGIPLATRAAPKSRDTPVVGETWIIHKHEVQVVAIAKEHEWQDPVVVFHYGDANYAEYKKMDEFRQVARKKKQ